MVFSISFVVFLFLLLSTNSFIWPLYLIKAFFVWFSFLWALLLFLLFFHPASYCTSDNRAINYIIDRQHNVMIKKTFVNLWTLTTTFKRHKLIPTPAIVNKLIHLNLKYVSVSVLYLFLAYIGFLSFHTQTHFGHFV